MHTHVLCPECRSSHLRPSRFRISDVKYLLVFRWPLRCRECRARFFAALPQAMKVEKHHKQSHVQHMTVPQ
jgi:hypothetical protein